MTNQFTIGNFCVTTPGDWLDITDSLEGGEDMPFTLAKDTGVGAFQVSVAEYRSGKHPEVKLVDLMDLRADFAARRDLGEASEETALESPIMLSGGSYRMGEDYLRIWFCSNGADVVLATYTVEWTLRNGEERECDEFVSSACFLTTLPDRS